MAKQSGLIILLVYLCRISVAGEADSLFAINSKNDILYLGIDNPLYLECRLKYDTSYVFTTNNGEILTDNDQLIILPIKKPDAYVYIYRIIENDTIIVDQKRFFISYVPKPCVIIANQCIINNTVVEKKLILSNPFLKIHISDDIKDSDSWIKIKRFSMGYKSGSIYRSFENTGNQLSDEMILVLEKIKSGQKVDFKITIESQGNLIRYLPIYSITVF